MLTQRRKSWRPCCLISTACWRQRRSSAYEDRHRLFCHRDHREHRGANLFISVFSVAYKAWCRVMKRLVQITLTISATLLALLLVWVFQPTLALFGGSLAISAALRPLVQHLETRGIKRGWVILIWYMLVLVA